MTVRGSWLGRRHLGLVAIACLLGLAGAAAPARPAALGCAAADGLHHVALVVEHGDGRILVRCVAFGAATISGAQALALSGVAYATTGYAGLGLAVCQLDGEPTTFPAGCWTDTGPYWVMFVARGGGAWTLSSLGISSQTLRDGDAEGFRYDAQTGSPAPPAAPSRCPPTSAPTRAPVSAPPSRRPSPRPVPTPGPPRVVPISTAPASVAAPTAAAQRSASGPASAAATTLPAAASTAGGAAASPRGRPLASSPASAVVPAAGVLALAVLLLVAIGVAVWRRRRTR